ncbi:tRNA pseudouridine(38-40) synthase TruA [Clostridium sp. MB40-C1]|uniref:tRNA pseudouridine(38-40) synthase TruA n=1 Tax=Clostridium sp. MB40-C1 TaxID=3070996 RepID=UPI0027E0233F|nr:tRNA pseudouridine(38-40) synthase TruA [Clostridium sp. MB40-C1]WMJ82149.1 tRNA pseudouridine(38-40) synthase TruA [Clostridium sp. MB40-C1]
MRNIRLTIQYDGSRYKGWQRLGNTENTIQYKIEKVLSTLLNENIELIASGRTDAGVHAENQIANFHTKSNISINTILNYCYRYLPYDIVVKKAEDVEESFHSRFNVSQKIYTYKICNSTFPDVFTRKYSYHVTEKLDVEKMKEVASLFIGTHDFKSFTALKSKKKSTIREIFYIQFKPSENGIDIIFSGNGFLYKMLRILSGTLIQAGLGKISPKEVKEILDAKDRSLAPDTAPSHGLFLTSVLY